MDAAISHPVISQVDRSKGKSSRPWEEPRAWRNQRVVPGIRPNHARHCGLVCTLTPPCRLIRLEEQASSSAILAFIACVCAMSAFSLRSASRTEVRHSTICVPGDFAISVMIDLHPEWPLPRGLRVQQR